MAPGSALEKFAAIVSPENKPTKVNWTLSWPSASEICGKSCSLIGLSFFLKVWTLNLAIAFVKGFFLLLLLDPGSALEKFAAIVNPETY